jgi:hypothetical protein
MVGEIVSTRTEHRLWFLMDISIEFTGKNSNLIRWMCVKYKCSAKGSWKLIYCM